jgi:murein L,D-transpeptidase YafK
MRMLSKLFINKWSDGVMNNIKLLFLLGLVLVIGLFYFGISYFNNENVLISSYLNEVTSIESLEIKAMKGSSKLKQDKNNRVKEARISKEKGLKSLFESKAMSYQPDEIFLRAFKQEKILEIWVKTKGNDKFQFLKSYNFTKSSGTLGPKRKEGDYQIPEGFYYINRFNPKSNFYLSLGINYPNQSDKILGHKDKPGGDIFIHGGAASVGCIPIGDENIKELYVLCLDVKSNGQKNIPVHIFPTKLTDEGINNLKTRCPEKKDLIYFWENLKVGYDYFEERKIVPNYSINENGEYIFIK